MLSKYLLNLGLSLTFNGSLFSISKSIVWIVFTVAGLSLNTTIQSDMLIASEISCVTISVVTFSFFIITFANK